MEAGILYYRWLRSLTLVDKHQIFALFHKPTFLMFIRNSFVGEKIFDM